MSRRQSPKPDDVSTIAAAAGAMPPPSTLAGQVPLVPGVGTVKRGEQHGQDQEEPAPPSAPARRAAARRSGRPGAPAVATAVALTVRMDPDEATEVDEFVLALRVQARLRTLDKAEVIRELLRLAREHEPTQRALLRRIS